MNRLLDDAAHLLLGAHCAGCGTPGRELCRDCRQSLCQEAPHSVPGLAVPVVASAQYRRVMRQLVLTAKERGGLMLLPLLTERLVLAVETVVDLAEPTSPLWLVPIPSNPTTVADRGVDVTGSLARFAARQLRASGRQVAVHRALRQRRRPADQAGLGVAERHSNLHGAYRSVGRPKPGSVIVVDDVVTTGATLSEALRALTVSGHEIVGAATVAWTPRHSGVS